MSQHPNEEPSRKLGSVKAGKKAACKKSISLTKRLVSIVVALVVVVCLLLSFLLFTHSGNALIWRQMTYSWPFLKGDLIEGELLKGWTLHDVSWSNEQVNFNADEIILEWHLARLLKSELPIQLARVKDASLTLKTSKPAEETAGSHSESPLNIPFNVGIDQLYLDNFTVQTPDTRLSIEVLHSCLQLKNSKLVVQEFLADQLDVTITSSIPTPAASGSRPLAQRTQGIDLSNLSLPTVQLSIPVEVKIFQLTNVHFKRGELEETIDQFNMSFNWQGSDIQQLTAALSSSKIDAKLSGNVQLSNNYPLEIQLNATLHDHFSIPQLKGLEGESISLAAAGDLQNLNIDANTQGAVQTDLVGTISPLKPQIPMDLKISWKSLKWPIAGGDKQQLSSESGALQVTGDLSQYQLSVNTWLHAIEQPPAQLTLDAQGNLKQLTINELTATLNQSSTNTALSKEVLAKAALVKKVLSLKGVLGWQSGIRWQGKLRLSDLHPQLWLPDINGTLSGEIDSALSINDTQWNIDVARMNVTGSLLEQPVAISGSLQAAGPKASIDPLSLTMQVDRLQAMLGKNNLDIHGAFGKKVALKGVVNAPALELLHADLSGQLEGEFSVSGSQQNPDLSFAFNSSRLTYQQTIFDHLLINGHLSEKSMLAGKVNLKADGLTHGNIQLKNLAVVAAGNEKKHRLTASADGEPVSGAISLDGSWQHNQWQGAVFSAAVHTLVDRWMLEKPLAVKVKPEQATTDLSSQCWQAQPARLCIGKTTISAESVTSNFKLSDFNLSSLKPIFPDHFEWQAVLSGNGDIQWRKDSPQMNIHLKTTPGRLINTAKAKVSAGYQQLSSHIQLRNDVLKADLQFASRQLGSARLNVAVNDVHHEQRLQGSATLQAMKLSFLQPLLPDVKNLSGNLSGDTTLGGTLKKPLIFGAINLNEGDVVTRSGALHISQLNTRVTMGGDHGNVSGNLKIGEGSMDLSGHLNWQQLPLSGVLTMKGHDLGIQYSGVLQLKASPDLILTLGETDVLTGTVDIPWARVEVKELPKRAVKPSKDVVFVTSENERKSSVAASPFAINLNVQLGKDIKIDAYGLKSGLTGKLNIKQQPNKPMTGIGSIELLNGRYHKLGQDLLIEEGKILFSGPFTSPYLSIKAIRNPVNTEGDVIVGVQVNGSPEQPEFTIFSTPAMSEEEQWSYLLRGHGFEDGEGTSVAALLVGFGVGQVGGVVTTLGEAVGFSDVQFATQGSGDDTQVVIGGTLAPGLRVQYGAGVFNALAELKIRYELLPRLYIQVISGVAQAVDLFYRFKVGDRSGG